MIDGIHIDQIVSRRSQWVGLLGGAVAWTMHILLAAIVGEAGCVTPLRDVGVFGIALPAFLLMIVSVLALALAAASMRIAFRNRERLRRAYDTGEGTDASREDTGRRRAYSSREGAGLDSPTSSGVDPRETGRYMARAGVISSLLFIFIILVQTVPIFYFLTRC